MTIPRVGVRASGAAFTVCLLALASSSGCHTRRVQIDRERLMAAAKHPEDWMTTGGDYGKTHYSELTSINSSNVSRLGLAWSYDTKSDRGLEATPIVFDGVMYTSGVGGRVYALTAATGAELWQFTPRLDPRSYRSTCCDNVNRGVAVWENRVYVAALDGVLYALDAQHGTVVWSADTIMDRGRGYSSTGAPEVAGSVVVIGNAGGEFDTRGYITAYDLQTGQQKWRFFTVPRSPQEPQEQPDLALAAPTWDPHSRWDIGGGGNVWDGMVYDPELKLLFVGTGNGNLYGHRVRSPNGGDNLFLASVLAIRADDGRLAWHYQETPGDQWDYDSDAPLILTTLTLGGQNRRVLLHAPKNGLFYILDRTDGRLLSATPYVPVSWTRGVDLNSGRPMSPEAGDYSNGPKVVYPSGVGAHSWNPMAYNPATGLVYLPASVFGQILRNASDTRRRPGLINMGTDSLPVDLLNGSQVPADLQPNVEALRRAAAEVSSPHSALIAWDPVQGRERWRAPAAPVWDHGGVLATAGGLVFHGSTDGHFRAFDASTGKLLQDIDTGTSIIAAPMTYSFQGVQYVAVMAADGGALWFLPHTENASYRYGNAGRVLSFRLDGAPTPMPSELPPEPPPPPPPSQMASPEQIRRGASLFNTDCVACHANVPRARAPDLTGLSPAAHQAFDSIVLGGVLKDRGMPQWSDVLSVEDAHAIHAYLISLSASKPVAPPTEQARIVVQ